MVFHVGQVLVLILSTHTVSLEFDAVGIVNNSVHDANDAEAIVEAAMRPTMRFVPVKTAEQQSRSMVFKTRDLLVRQRNSIVNRPICVAEAACASTARPPTT